MHPSCCTQVLLQEAMAMILTINVTNADAFQKSNHHYVPAPCVSVHKLQQVTTSLETKAINLHLLSFWTLPTNSKDPPNVSKLGGWTPDFPRVGEQNPRLSDTLICEKYWRWGLCRQAEVSPESLKRTHTKGQIFFSLLLQLCYKFHLGLAEATHERKGKGSIVPVFCVLLISVLYLSGQW